MSSPSDWRSVPLAPRLRVAPDSGRRATALAGLTGAADWRRRIADAAGVACLAVVGADRLRPGGPPDWPEAGLTALGRSLEHALPTLRLAGAVLPRQPGRARLSLLGRMTGNTVVVKVGRPDDGIEHEATVLTMLSVAPLPGVATPVPMAFGHCAVGDQVAAYLVTFAVSIRRQRPVDDAPLRTFETDLGRSLAALPRPSNAAVHDVPVHGDLAPYNLRRTARGLALFDWEHATWGPPGSDLDMYRERCDLLAAGRPIPPPEEMLEARRR